MNPIAVIVITLVSLAIFIGALAYASWWGRARKKAQRRSFADAAVARGWTYDAKGSGWIETFSVKPFRTGARKRRAQALDVVSGILYGRRAVGFHYRYVRGTNPDNLSDITSEFTICAVVLPDEFTAVDPSRLSFSVDRGNDMVQHVMLARRRVHWSVDGRWLMCWERGTRASVQEVFARLELLSAIIDGRAGRMHVA